MGLKLSELEEGSNITLLISSKDRVMTLDAVIKKHIKENIAFITLQCDTSKRLVFDSVQVDMEYYQD